MAADPVRAAAAKRRRLFWMQQLRRWHWISSAVSLAGLLLFAATGLTLNHAADIGAEPRVVARHASLPGPLVAGLANLPEEGRAPLPAPVRDWVKQTLSVTMAGGGAEWSPEEVFVDLPRPGGEGSLTIDRRTGAVAYEQTSRGLVALLNDLHKGRNTGAAWKGFIDVFAGACLVFALTGLTLLHLHAKARPLTWPLVALGAATPALIAAAFLHLL
jgi:hypothetical protein